MILGSPLAGMWADDPSMAPVDQDSIPTWNNFGSLAGDWTQADPAKQPLWDNNAANGKPALVFDAATFETMKLGDTYGRPAEELTVVTVGYAPPAGLAVFAIATQDGLATYTYTATITDVGYAAVSGADISGGDTSALSVLVFRVADIGGGDMSYTLRVNGVEIASLITAAMLPATDELWIGSGADIVGWLTGPLAFAGVYAGPTEPAGLEAGLMTFYGVTP